MPKDKLLKEASEFALRKIKELPMDEASRLARAKEMGYDIDKTLYHGTSSPENFSEFKPSTQGLDGSAVYLAKEPKMAGQYSAGAQGANDPTTLRQPQNARTIPVHIKTNTVFDVNNMDDLRSLLQKENIPVPVGDLPYLKFFDLMQKKYPNVDISNPDIPQSIQNLTKKHGYGGIADGSQVAIWDPKNIRSTSAVFDPTKKDSKNILSGMVGAGLIGGAAMTPEQADAALASPIGEGAGQIASNSLKEIDNVTSLPMRKAALSALSNKPYSQMSNETSGSDVSKAFLNRIPQLGFPVKDPLTNEVTREYPLEEPLGLAADMGLDVTNLPFPELAMTKGAFLLGGPKMKALRKLINVGGGRTREELISTINKYPQVIDKLEGMNPQSLIDYLKQIGRRVNKSPEVQEILTPLEQRTEKVRKFLKVEPNLNVQDLNASKTDASIGGYNFDNPTDYSEYTPIINQVEELTGIKTPLSTMDRVTSNIKETPYTPKPSKSMIQDYGVVDSGKMETPTHITQRIRVSPSTDDKQLGYFSFEVITDKQTGKVLIQPTGSRSVEPRKGIGTDVYKFMEQKFGGKIIPDSSRSQDALAMHLQKGYGREFGIPTTDQQPSEYESKYNFITDYLAKSKKK